MIGSRVGHFEILDQLGQGGMGVVWKARDETLDRIVALKLVRIRHNDGGAQTAQLLREARMASVLNHPNIVTVYEVGEHAGSIYVAMEYVEGQTLHQMIPGGGLSVDTTLRITSQIADGLAAAHAAGLIHRDLKPSNIIVTPAGKVKILDFGLARPTPGGANEDDTRTMGSITESLAGTPAYMSPEQVSGLKIDARSDLFSVGALMYEALSGRPAFKGRSPSLTMASVARDEPPPLENIPPELERLVMRLLRKDPERRWQTALDLKAALEDLREESETRRLSPVSLASPEPRVPKWTWIAASLGGMAAAAAGVYAWLVPEVKPAWPEPVISQFSVGSGLQIMPSFSADGNQIAYSWNGNDGSNFDIYVQAVNGGERVRLTKDPAEDTDPVWSPTGERIAFVRAPVARPRSIYMIGPLGGVERRIIDLPVNNLIEQSIGMCWTRDGKNLIYGERSQPDGLTELMLVVVDTGEKRPLSRKGRYLGSEPALSPDGRRLAFVREGSSLRLWGASFDSEKLEVSEAFLLTQDDRRLASPAWTVDGTEVIVTDERVGADNRLLRVTPSTGAIRLVEYAGTPAAYAALSPKGGLMAFTRTFADCNIWKLKLNATGNVVGDPEQLIVSSYLDMQPAWSPDGQKIAFESTRSGKSRVWVSDRSGAPLFQIGAGPEHTGSPAWSPDGRWLAYDTLRPGQHVYVAPVGGGPTRAIATDYYTPWWSRDGKTLLLNQGAPPFVYFFRVPVEGGEFTGLNPVPSRYPRETFDSRHIVYERTVRPGSRQLWKMPIAGGDPVLLADKVMSRTWDIDAEGVWYIEPEADNCGRLMYLKFGRSEPRAVYRSPKPLMRGLSVSPERREILFAPVDGRGSSIMLLENFR